MKFIKDFFKLEAASGIIIVFAAISALIIANSPYWISYGLFLDFPVEFRAGTLFIEKPLFLWINDGLMTVFFFLVGLELKREVMEGELSVSTNLVLPVLGAIGGIIVPVLIYIGINWSDEIAIRGWAIPAATDMALVLGVLSLLGNRVSTQLKIFLVSITLIDDIAAAIIIVLFYTEALSSNYFFIALSLMPVLYILNRLNVVNIIPYFLVGIVLWVVVLKSGIHEALAGLILALFIPLKSKRNSRRSPLKELEHDLHPVVAFGVLPLFAFANAGVSLQGIDLEFILHPVSLGIAAGLFVGKQLGVFSFCWVALKSGFVSLPSGINLIHLYGVSLLCGLGFSRGFFISSLAFRDTDMILPFDERLGIIMGTVLSGICGYLVLYWSTKNRRDQTKKVIHQ